MKKILGIIAIISITMCLFRNVIRTVIIVCVILVVSIVDKVPSKQRIINIFVENKAEVDIVFDYFEAIEGNCKIDCHKYALHKNELAILGEKGCEYVAVDKSILDITNKLHSKYNIRYFGKNNSTFYFRFSLGYDEAGVAYMSEGDVPSIDYLIEFEPINGYEGYYYYYKDYEAYERGEGLLETSTDSG